MQASVLMIGLLGGVAIATQVSFNAALRGPLGSYATAALVNFLVGTFALMIFAMVTRVPLPGRVAAAAAPWWAWLGGLLGAFYVTTASLVGQRIGVTALLALTVTGQLAASLVIDQYGLLGMAQQGFTLSKLTGSILLVAGMLLIVR